MCWFLGSMVIVWVGRAFPGIVVLFFTNTQYLLCITIADYR